MGTFWNGVIVGVGVGLLLAPKKGEETRHIVSSRFNAIKSKIESKTQSSQNTEAYDIPARSTTSTTSDTLSSSSFSSPSSTTPSSSSSSFSSPSSPSTSTPSSSSSSSSFSQKTPPPSTSTTSPSSLGNTSSRPVGNTAPSSVNPLDTDTSNDPLLDDDTLTGGSIDTDDTDSLPKRPDSFSSQRNPNFPKGPKNNRR